MPPLLLDVKDTLRAMSSQDGEAGRSELRNEVTVTSHGNKALVSSSFLRTVCARMYSFFFRIFFRNQCSV